MPGPSPNGVVCQERQGDKMRITRSSRQPRRQNTKGTGAPWELLVPVIAALVACVIFITARIIGYGLPLPNGFIEDLRRLELLTFVVIAGGGAALWIIKKLFL